MPDSRPGNMTEVFDDMLARERSEFNNLFNVPDSYTRRSLSVQRSSTSSVPPSIKNAAADALSRRFGNDWRFDIVEQRRDGDELIVVGRVSIPSQQISVTQSASIPVMEARAQSGQISGAVNGIAFTAGLNDSGQDRQAGQSSEEAVLQKALEKVADEVMRSCLRWF